MRSIKSIIVAAATMTLAACGGEASAPEAPAGPAIDVTAKELAAAYEANEAGAQLKYGKSVLNVSGRIKSIDLGIGDEPYLVLSGANEFSGPQAKLDKASQAQAPNLQKGQTVQLRCLKVSEIMGTAMLDECSIVSSADPKK